MNKNFINKLVKRLNKKNTNNIDESYLKKLSGSEKALMKIPGIGNATAKKLKIFYNTSNKKKDIFDKICDELDNIKYNDYILFLRKECSPDDIINLERSYSWFKNDLIAVDEIKNKILSYWIKFMTNEKKQINNLLNCSIYFENIRRDPMLLKVLKYTFKKIDKIALKNKWWEDDDKYRYECFVYYLFDKYSTKSGHIFIYNKDIEDIITYDLVIDKDIFFIILDNLIKQKKIVQINNKYSLSKYFHMESVISRITLYFKNLKYEKFNLKKKEFDNNITDEQLNAINGILSNPISILLGKGGTGKTSCVTKNVCEYITKNESLNGEIYFITPTHAAKKNGKNEIKIENINYSTIQSFNMKYEVKKNFKLNKIRYIFIDEFSMVNINDFFEFLLLCYNYSIGNIDYFDNFGDEFLEDVNFENSNYNDNDLKIIFIGDHNQLQPIGIGNPLLDLIDKIPTFRLTKNFRSKNSDIPIFCDTILGEINKNFWSFRKSSANCITNKFDDVTVYFDDDYKEKLNIILEKLKNDSYVPYCCDDNQKVFQVITLENKKCNELTKIVRKYFPKIYKKNSNRIYDEKDIIIFKKNTPLFKNGDYGKIIKINHRDSNNESYYIKVLNDYDSENIKIFEKKSDEYDFTLISKNKNKNEIILDITDSYFKPSFAKTVHSSQGLGFPVIIFIINKESLWNINRNLLYTAYSRAKKHLYLLGNLQCFNGDKAREPSKPRNTFLSDMIKNKNKYEKYNIIYNKDHINNENNKNNENNLNKEYTKDLNKKLGKKIRKKIPKEVGNDVWIKYNGKKYKGSCYVCNKKITITDHHIGHVVSKSNGGDDNIENLRPICGKCNCSMGTKNLEEYKKQYYMKK